MNTLRALGLTVLAVACSCSKGERPGSHVDGGANAGTAYPIARQRDPDTSISTVLGADTVWLVPLEGNTRLLWTSAGIGGRKVRWESRPLYSAMPYAVLIDANGDSIPDLFWTIRHEEFIGGMLLLGSRGGASTAFQTDGRACRVPELRDVTADGRLDVVEYVPGAFTPESCQGDAPAIRCQEEYLTEWPIVWTQSDSGFTPDSSRARRYYLDRGAQFEAAATKILEEVRRQPAGTAHGGCDSATARTLQEMGVRAYAIGQAE